jgi:hypothetical protein
MAVVQRTSPGPSSATLQRLGSRHGTLASIAPVPMPLIDPRGLGTDKAPRSLTPVPCLRTEHCAETSRRWVDSLVL